MDQLQSVLNETTSLIDNIEDNVKDPSLTPTKSSLVEEFYQQDESIGEPNINKYISYVASRVRRNLRLEKGKLLDSLPKSTYDFI